MARTVWYDMPQFSPIAGMPTQEDVNASTPAGGGFPPAPVDPNDQATQEYLAQLRRQQAEEAELNRQLTEQQQKNMGLAQQDIAQQQKALEGYKQLPIQTDLSPIASMLDAWYGTNQAKNYHPSETPQSRMEMIRQLQAGLNKARGALSESEMSLLRTRLNASAMKEQAALKALNAKTLAQANKEQKKERDDAKLEIDQQKLRDSLSKSDIGKTIPGFINFKSALKTMREFVEQKGLPTSGVDLDLFNNLMSQAKLSAKDKFALGAITDSDAKLIGGLLGSEGGWTKVLASKLLRGSSAGAARALKQLEDATDKDFDRQLKNLRTSHPSKVVTPILDEYKSQYKTVSGGGVVDDSYDALPESMRAE